MATNTISFNNLTTRKGGPIEFDNQMKTVIDRSGIRTHRFGNGALRQVIKGTRPTYNIVSGSISALTSAEVSTLVSNINIYGIAPNYITYTVNNSTCKFIVDGDIEITHMSGDYYRVDLKLIEVFY